MMVWVLDKFLELRNASDYMCAARRDVDFAKIENLAFTFTLTWQFMSRVKTPPSQYSPRTNNPVRSMNHPARILRHDFNGR